MCNRLWTSYRSALAAALLIAAVCPAWSQTTQPSSPRLDHVEDELAAKLPGYVRFTSEPPPPPPPNVLTPASGWSSIKPGMTYVLKATAEPYKAPGKVGANWKGCTFVSEQLYAAVIQGSQGKVNYDGTAAGGVTWSGVVFQAGGTQDRLNDKAGVLTGVKDHVVDCVVEKMWGVGISTNDDVVLERVESRFNGSAAAGGIGDRWRIVDPWFHDCNFQTRDTDGGGIKATRGLYWSVTGGRFERILGVCVWADIKNAGYYVADCSATELGSPSSSKPWLGNFFKAELDLEAPDGRRSIVERNHVTRNFGPAFLVEESPNVTVRFNLGDVAYGNGSDKDTLHWRQNTRADTQAKTGKAPPAAWWLKNCEAYGNGPATPGADFVIGTSSANLDERRKPFTLDLKWLVKWNVRMWENQNSRFRNIK
jgi:hypothetical protein